jgi:fatty acid desaturase
LILSGRFGAGTMLVLANIYGIAALLAAINIGHDGAHAALARPRWINDVALYTTFMLIGADPYLWRMRHVRSHHVFPNVNGCDIDIDSNLFLAAFAQPPEAAISALSAPVRAFRVLAGRYPHGFHSGRALSVQARTGEHDGHLHSAQRLCRLLAASWCIWRLSSLCPFWFFDVPWWEVLPALCS